MTFFLARVLNKLGLIKNVNLIVARSLNNKKVQIPVINGLGYDNLYAAELWIDTVIEKLLSKKKGAFIDVGVNVGQTLLKLRGIDPAVDYIGFEPNPSCIYYAESLIRANAFLNCRIVPVGLLDKDTVLQLGLNSETDPAASVVENFRPGQKISRKIYVPVNRFDTVDEKLQIGAISIIKIDVEGAELEVLQGLVDTIKSKRPSVIMEILPCYTSENVMRIKRQEQVERIFDSLNYKMFRIKKNGRVFEKLEPIEAIGIHGDIAMSDYVFVPGESSGEINSL
jgi:FkbM family methyltransferase